MTAKKPAPRNPKNYTPVLQQPYCCVPASLQMILARHGYQDYTQETLGNRLGLVVPLRLKHVFKNVAATEKPPTHGWGTHINLKKYSLQALFKKEQLPFRATFKLSDRFKNAAALKKTLVTLARDAQKDTLLCVQSGALQGFPMPDSGHVILLTAADRENIYYLDPAIPEEGVQQTTYEQMLYAMRLRGPENYGGVWGIRNL